MVIASSHASFADTAVLTAGRLEEPARLARVARIVENAIIGVLSHLGGVIEGCDVRLRVSRRTQVGEKVW